MTTNKTFSERNRDAQDGVERHAFGEIAYVDNAGALITIRGTGTVDEKAVLVNSGYGFNLSKNAKAEVFALASGSDMSQKYVIPTLPRDKQRKWKENTGGVQNPTDPEKALEFNSKRAHVTDPNFAVAMSGIFEVKDGKVYIRGDIIVQGGIHTLDQFYGPDPVPNSATIPGFDP